MEYFDVYNEDSSLTGRQVSREQAHRDGILHKTAHVWITRKRDGKRELLLQMRSARKDSFPGCYDISSAGHIPAGDAPVVSALRELREELGVQAQEADLRYCGLRRIATDHVFHGKPFHDRQLSEVYLLYLDREEESFTVQKEEIDFVRWMEFEEVVRGVREHLFPNCIVMEELEMLRRAMAAECSLILDTDIGPDCDDAAALALVNLYHRRGYVNVLAVTHCTSSPWGAGAIRAVCRQYGNEFPVGTMEKQGFLATEDCMRYNRALAMTVPESERRAEGAVRVLRRTLASAPDHSIRFVDIGPLGNLAALLTSAPDDLSPLPGEELMNLKCESLICMAGCFPDGGEGLPHTEWNIEMDIPAAHEVFARWHGRLVLCGWEVGGRVEVGMRHLPLGHPVREAYRLHNADKDRATWDLLTVQYACVPEQKSTVCSEPGIITLAPDGHTDFIPQEGGKHAYLRLNGDRAAIAHRLQTELTEHATV